MEEGGMLLVLVSLLLIHPGATSIVNSRATFSLALGRIFATSLAGVLSPVASAGYVLLAKQFNVSVDEITSSFGALLLGLGIFMQVFRSLQLRVADIGWRYSGSSKTLLLSSTDIG